MGTKEQSMEHIRNMMVQSPSSVKLLLMLMNQQIVVNHEKEIVNRQKKIAALHQNIKSIHNLKVLLTVASRDTQRN